MIFEKLLGPAMAVGVVMGLGSVSRCSVGGPGPRGTAATSERRIDRADDVSSLLERLGSDRFAVRKDASSGSERRVTRHCLP